MKSDSEEITDHFKQIVLLSQELGEFNWNIYQHNYNLLSFGSWELVVGTRHTRIKFIWDGKESLLSYYRSQFVNSNSLSNWILITEKSLIGKALEEVYKICIGEHKETLK